MPHWELFYHLVWSTRGRHPWLTAEVEPVAHGLIREKSLALGARVHALNGTEDHVHLVVELPPKLSISRFIGQVKAVSSTMLNRQVLQGFGWQPEYGAFTVTPKHLPTVVGYVESQKERHARGRLNRALETS